MDHFNICIVANMHIVTARDLPVWVLLPVWICVAWDELNPTGGGALPTGIPFWGFPFSPWYTDGREAWRDSLLKLFAIYVWFTSELEYEVIRIKRSKTVLKILVSNCNLFLESW